MAESNWRDLCELIRYEMDPQELMRLVEELNRTLAHQEGERQRWDNREPAEQYQEEN
jgi:hypothetical protein